MCALSEVGHLRDQPTQQPLFLNERIQWVGLLQSYGYFSVLQSAAL